MFLAEPMLDELNAALQNATAQFQHCSEQVDVANREKTEALNKLNNAQKAFDLAVAEIKKSAPRGSDWTITRREL